MKSKYDAIKIGDKVEIQICHYAHNRETQKSDDQSKIWVNVVHSEINEFEDWKLRLGGGYMNNPYPKDYFGDSGNFRKTSIEGVLKDFCFKEHMNGGRGNVKSYSSITEYFADPLVKELFFKKIKGGLFGMQAGDPDKVDFECSIRLVEFPITAVFKESIWEDFIPREWYNEVYADAIKELSTINSWDTYEEAFENQQRQDDLFGERYFPVIKAPLNLKEVMLECAGNFKSHSKPIDDGTYVYIGLRSKSYELSEMSEVYNQGGTILKHKEWDW